MIPSNKLDRERTNRRMMKLAGKRFGENSTEPTYAKDAAAKKLKPTSSKPSSKPKGKRKSSTSKPTKLPKSYFNPDAKPKFKPFDRDFKPTLNPLGGGKGSPTDRIADALTPKKSSSPSPAPKSESKPKSSGSYKVKRGDSLWRIAASRLGKGSSNASIANEMNRIYKKNKKTIGGNPSLIHTGQDLKF